MGDPPREAAELPKREQPQPAKTSQRGRGLRITTWNVNGLKNLLKYPPFKGAVTLSDMLNAMDVDILILQEVKLNGWTGLTAGMVHLEGWDMFYDLPESKPGYSGVAIYVRIGKCCPVRAERGLTGALRPVGSDAAFKDLPPCQQIGGYPTLDQLLPAVDLETVDSEGRTVVVEFPAFVVIGVYCPALCDKEDERRATFRTRYLRTLDARVRNLVALGKEVVLCGDINVSRPEPMSTPFALIEMAEREKLLSDPARRWFDGLVHGGQLESNSDSPPLLWDTTRLHHPRRKNMFTCWDTKKNGRPANIGSRIDYVLCTSGIRDWFVEADIQEQIYGSDHCPVYGLLSETVQHGGKTVALVDITNPTGRFVNGIEVKRDQYRAFIEASARRLPAFRGQKSIINMFQKKPVVVTGTEREPEDDQQTAARQTENESGGFEEESEAVKWTSKRNVLPAKSPQADKAEALLAGQDTRAAAAFAVAAHIPSTVIADSGPARAAPDTPSETTPIFSKQQGQQQRQRETSLSGSQPQQRKRRKQANQAVGVARLPVLDPFQPKLSTFFKKAGDDATATWPSKFPSSANSGLYAVPDTSAVRRQTSMRSQPSSLAHQRPVTNGRGQPSLTSYFRLRSSGVLDESEIRVLPVGVDEIERGSSSAVGTGWMKRLPQGPAQH